MAPLFDNLRITTDFSIRLCARLRERGVEIGTQQSIACMQSILLLGHVQEEELRQIYQLTLINRKQDLWHLHRAYELLLQDYQSPRKEAEDESDHRDEEPVVTKRRYYSEENSATGAGEETTRTEGYSTREVDHLKDFRFIPKTEFAAVMHELKKIVKRHATVARRRTRRTKRRGRVDLRASARDSVKFGGEILNWRYKTKVPTHARFVVVADVSGSMEIYSIFLLNFLYLLSANRRISIESFVFSTRLERLTKQFRSRNFPEMLKNIALHFSGWSGGTKIGAAIETLNEAWGTLITPKTSVVIMSDGWDTGDVALLDREMARLHRRAKTIVWINPLKGCPGYEPLAMGMAAARPHCDQFITGHSINSLEKFASLLNL